MTTAVSSTNEAIYNALNGTSSSSSSSKSSSSSAASMQTTFLKLLTTQLQNQDPTNPMDSAQTTSQLAQISTVEGITNLNDTLKSMMTNMQNNDALQAANLVGHAVLVEGSKMTLSSSSSSSSGSAVGGVELASAADSVVVTIKDANGNVVNTVDLGNQSAGTATFTWDGKDSAGTAVANGTYTVSIAASLKGASVTATALQLGTVNSVSNSSSGAKVNVSGVGPVATSGIKLIL